MPAYVHSLLSDDLSNTQLTVEEYAALRVILANKAPIVPTRTGLLGMTRRLYRGYKPNWHHVLIARYLQLVERGYVKRLMIFTPPRHGKSELVSKQFPAYYLANNPDHRIILTSYAAELARSFSGAARNAFMNEAFPWQLPLAWDSWSARRWNLEKPYRGGVIAAGVGGTITGYGAHLAIIDDPVKNQEEAESLVRRNTVHNWYQSTLYTRLEEGGAIVLVMTRWHEDDLAGRLLQEQADGGEEWVVLNLPALAEEPEDWGKLGVRLPGEALWESKFSREHLEAMRDKGTVSSRVWNALYQQRPVPLEGGLFKHEWFDIIKDSPRIPCPRLDDILHDASCPSCRGRNVLKLRWVRYWDLATSTKTSADYTCSIAMAVHDGHVYLRDGIHGRWEWPQAKRLIKSTMLNERGSTVQHGIESAMHGLAAVQELRADPDLLDVAIRSVDVHNDKQTRALPLSARAEAGKVHVVGGSWVQSFLAEITSFPNAAHDDWVDAASGGLALLVRRTQVGDLNLAGLEAPSKWRP